jgi:hypothetical protein
MRDPLAKKDDPNPRKAEIDTAWNPIEVALSRYDGREACRLMLAVYDMDRAIWNGCRGRVRRWLVQWFRARGLGRWDKFPQDDFSAEAFTTWIRSIYTDRREPENYGSEDLPYIMQELDDYSRRIDKWRANTLPVDTSAVRGAVDQTQRSCEWPS